MGHVLLVFGTLVMLNIGIVSKVSDNWYAAEGKVEIEDSQSSEPAKEE